MVNERNLPDAIWLRRENYHVMPLNTRLVRHTVEVERAIERGISARPDAHRDDFYVIELATGCVYIHVRENAKTVYVVAYSSSAQASSAKLGSTMMVLTPCLEC
jgi:hypothetical protein